MFELVEFCMPYLGKAETEPVFFHVDLFQACLGGLLFFLGGTHLGRGQDHVPVMADDIGSVSRKFLVSSAGRGWILSL